MKKMLLSVCLLAFSFSFAQTYDDLEQFHQDSFTLHEIESSEEVSLEQSTEFEDTDTSEQED